MDRAQVMAALDNIEPHSPTWVKGIRRYIVHLERELGINPEFNARLRKAAGKPVNALKMIAPPKD